MKAGILVTARLESTRLPKKVLKLMHGKPMIVRLLDRLKQSKEADMVSIITSPLEEDRPLVEIAAQEGVDCFQGHPVDVLQRIHDAAHHFRIDLIASCTGDNPFTDWEHIDRMLRVMRDEQLDFVRMDGLPLGAFSYGLRTIAVDKAISIKDEVDTEVWGGYFTETGLFNNGAIEPIHESMRWPELRLTVDTPEDFEVAERIYRELEKTGEVSPLRDVVEFCRQHPELTAINREVVQRAGIPIRLKEGYREE